MKKRSLSHDALKQIQQERLTAILVFLVIAAVFSLAAFLEPALADSAQVIHVR